MGAKVIAAAIAGDTIDRTAAQVMTDNPGMFASASLVPDHLRLSVKTLWLGAAAPPADLAKYVVANPGDGKGIRASNIYLIERTLYESTQITDSFSIDETGAEVMYLDILIGRGDQPIDDHVKDVDLRIQWLLDANIRQTHRDLPPVLPVTDGMGVPYDLTIQDPTFYCHFHGYVQPPQANYIVTRYRLNYYRLFAK